MPVSVRRVFHTVLDWAGIDSANSLRAVDGQSPQEVVLGEAMKPFLGYGWQPQVMAIAGRHKAILAGKIEAYDVIADPAETKNLGAGSNLSAALRKALDDYPVPSPEAARVPENLSDEARRNLASLGYVSASAPPVVRKDAPRPVDMVGLFDVLEKASGLFVQEQYAQVIPLLEKILAADPHNLDAALRLATAHSSLGHDAQALAAFKTAAAIAPRSPDVRTYVALHYARGKDWQQAVPLLERIVAETPERLPAVEALAVVRERQGRFEEAIALRQKIASVRTPTASDLARLGQLAMQAQQTPLAIESFEKANVGRAGLYARSRARRPLSGRAEADRGARRTRPRSTVASGVSDGALQARAGECSLEGAWTAPRESRVRASAPTARRGSSSRKNSCFGRHASRNHRCLLFSSRSSRSSRMPAVTPAGIVFLELQPCRQLEPPRIVERSCRVEVRRVHGRLEVVSRLVVEDVEQVGVELQVQVPAEPDVLDVFQIHLPVRAARAGTGRFGVPVDVARAGGQRDVGLVAPGLPRLTRLRDQEGARRRVPLEVVVAVELQHVPAVAAQVAVLVVPELAPGAVADEGLSR